MSNNIIDSLEIQIESESKSAQKSLDSLVLSLKKIKKELGFDPKGFDNLSEGSEKIAGTLTKSLKPLQELNKSVDKLNGNTFKFNAKDMQAGIDNLRKQFKDAGKGFSFSGNFEEANKEIASLSLRLDRLFGKEDKLKALGANINTQGFKSLEYDISLLSNKLDILKVKREELQDAFNKGLAALPVMRGSDIPDVEQERSIDISPNSMMYNKDAMKAVFGEAFAPLTNFNQAVLMLGQDAGLMLNQIGDSASGMANKLSGAGEIVRKTLKDSALSAAEFEGYLENLQIPEIRISSLKKLQAELDKTEAKLDELQVKSDNWAAKGINPDGAKFRNLQEQIVSLSKKSDVLRKKIQTVGNTAPKSAGLGKIKSILESMPQAFEKIKISAKGTVNIFDLLKKKMESIRKLIPGIGKIGQSLSGGSKGANYFGIGKMMGMSILYSGVFRMISGITNAVKTGSNNMAQYSSVYNASISQMLSALTRLKNAFAVAFAPIVNVVAPYITTFINMLSTAMNKVGQFLSILTGKSFTPQAVTVVQDYAAGLQDTSQSMDDSTSSAKKLKKALSVLSFDNLNQLTASEDSSVSAGSETSGAGELLPSDMFTTTPALQEIKDFADKVKSIFSSLFRPFKEAWAEEGKKTVDAAKEAFRNLVSLAESVGRSFMSVWTNGTGAKTLKTLLQIAQNLFKVVGNLSKQFEKAWNKAGLGTSIIQNIFNLGNSVLETVRNITGATAEWAETLNFTPLLSSINKLLQALQPLTKNIGTGLEWFWSNVLLPIGSWTLQDAVPTFLNMLSGGIGAANSVITALQPLGTWLWEYFLQPLGQWTGEAVIGAMKTVIDLLNGFSAWVSEHQELVQGFTVVVGSFAAAGGLVSGAVTIWNGVATLASGITTALGTAIGFLTSPIGIAVAAIGGIIAAGVLLYKNWDVVKEKCGQLKDWIVEKTRTLKENVVNTFAELKEKVNNILKMLGEYIGNIWDKIKTTVTTVVTTVKDWAVNGFNTLKTKVSNIMESVGDKISSVWSEIKGNFSDIIGWIRENFTKRWSSAWERVKTIFSNVFEGLKNLVKVPINAVLGIVNSAISKINSAIGGIESALSFGPWEIPTPFGSRTIGFSVSFPRLSDIPYLAKGGLVSAPTFAMIGEAGSEAVLPLENRKTMSRVADSILSNSSSMGLNEKILTNAVARGVAMAMMNNQQNPINVTCYAELRTEDNEVLARAVTKGQQSLDYRMHPTPQFG